MVQQCTFDRSQCKTFLFVRTLIGYTGSCNSQQTTETQERKKPANENLVCVPIKSGVLGYLRLRRAVEMTQRAI